MRIRTTLGLAALMAPVLLAACGSGQTGSATSTTNRAPDLTIQALDIRFDSKTYTATATSGKVLISYTDKGQQFHTLSIKDSSGAKIPDFHLQVTPGKTQAAEVPLAPGTYKLYCDVTGHEAAGMVATLTVG